MTRWRSYSARTRRGLCRTTRRQKERTYTRPRARPRYARAESAQRTDSRSAVATLLRTIKRGAAGRVTKQRDIGLHQTVLLTTVTGYGDHARCVGFTGTNGRAASPVTGGRDA